MGWFWLPVISFMVGGVGSLWACLCSVQPWIMPTASGLLLRIERKPNSFFGSALSIISVFLAYLNITTSLQYSFKRDLIYWGCIPTPFFYKSLYLSVFRSIPSMGCHMFSISIGAIKSPLEFCRLCRFC